MQTRPCFLPDAWMRHRALRIAWINDAGNLMLECKVGPRRRPIWMKLMCQDTGADQKNSLSGSLCTRVTKRYSSKRAMFSLPTPGLTAQLLFASVAVSLSAINRRLASWMKLRQTGGLNKPPFSPLQLGNANEARLRSRPLHDTVKKMRAMLVCIVRGVILLTSRPEELKSVVPESLMP